MTSRFWFLTYNLILLPLLSGIVKILASYNSKISEGIEKRKVIEIVLAGKQVHPEMSWEEC